MVVGIFISVNKLDSVLNLTLLNDSLKCTVTSFFFSINHFLYCFSAFCPKTINSECEKFNVMAISTQVRSNFSANAGIHDLQLSFCEANFT